LELVDAHSKSARIDRQILTLDKALPPELVKKCVKLRLIA
jgi:hypothetical protein